jgi:hypothetical protein
MRLTKAQSRQRWHELRALWNEFDPIGVMPNVNWPPDEYEAYVGPTMRLLEQDASVEEILKCLEWAVCDRMGLEMDREAAMRFTNRIQQWFKEKWRDTYV